ncbi:hypothetical protein PV327_004584 [Microctonus hyperodae]|uniref:Uncharacterized protein n=1 Tax=Microctonus hyperodae TaxID=165561 RepID=A0AA39FCT6_MICHY|nr:hypothetical protein PV327_004584 [Microctonus hyperodae]
MWKRFKPRSTYELFISFTKKISMESVPAKRPKMCEVEKPTQSSSDDEEIADREITSNANLENSYYDERLIIEFINSFENLARSTTKKNFLYVANSMKNRAKKEQPKSKFEFLCLSYVSLQQRLRHVRADVKTHERKYCDLVYIEGFHRVGFIMNFKFDSGGDTFHNCDRAHDLIFKRKFDTILNDDQVRRLFPNYTWTLQKRIYLGIHFDKNFKVSIKYSIDGKEPADTVSTGDE